MIVSNFLTNVRYILSDTEKTRWTDNRLIVLINKGLLDLSIKTKLFVSKGFFEIIDEVTEYDISSQAVKLTRAQFNERKLPFKTLEEMDRISPTWQLDKGTEPKFIIINKQNRANFTIYPIVENPGVPAIEFDGIFGIITSLDSIDFSIEIETNFGLLAVIEDPKVVIIYFSERQPTITVVEDELGLDDFVSSALVNYVAGFAFLDDKDDQHRTMGQEQLGFYASMLQTLEDNKSQDNTIHSYTTPYIAM